MKGGGGKKQEGGGRGEKRGRRRKNGVKGRVRGTSERRINGGGSKERKSEEDGRMNRADDGSGKK